jgi:hypothetical protein
MTSNPRFSSILISLFLAAALQGQVSLSVAPSPVPVGCQVAINIANDTSTPVILSSPCPFQIRNPAGIIIFNPTCLQVPWTVNPGAVHVMWWSQVDNGSAPVPPGTYSIEVLLPGGMSTVTVQIDATLPAGIGLRGVARIGTTRNLQLCSPLDSLKPYVIGASLGLGAIPTCNGPVPLQADWLFSLSLGPNPYFASFSGTLFQNGSTLLPSVTMPFDPTLVGASFVVAFVVIDLSGPCIIGRISAPHVIIVV